MTPLTHQRIASFKANKRGYYASIVLAVLFVISLLAECLMNDRPLLVYYEGDFYVPFIKTYDEITFGGDFETEADYRDSHVIHLIEKKGWILWPPIRFHHDTIHDDLPSPAPSPPTKDNWLGTDDQGRDVMARLVYGFRLSLLFGFILTFFSACIGVIMGGLQGYFGGRFDLICQRILEIWSGMPLLYLLIIMGSLVMPTFWWILGLMLMFSWISLVGIVRAEFLRARNFEYVRAARAMGVPTFTLIKRHILPNAMVATLTYLPFMLNGSIGTLTSLDFLGFGLPPGSPSLGELLAQGKNNLHAPWLGLSSFLTIALTLSLLIFMGEAIRDAFDPRKAQE